MTSPEAIYLTTADNPVPCEQELAAVIPLFPELLDLGQQVAALNRERNATGMDAVTYGSIARGLASQARQARLAEYRKTH